MDFPPNTVKRTFNLRILRSLVISLKLVFYLTGNSTSRQRIVKFRYFSLLQKNSLNVEAVL